MEKGTKFSTELISIHPFSVVLFQDEKIHPEGLRALRWAECPAERTVASS